MSEKVLTGKSALKKILPVAIAILAIILFAVIFSSIKSSAPNPTISDKDSEYLSVGGYKVSREKLYNYLRKNYGVSELARLIDTKLLEDEVSSVTDQELDKFVIETLFGVEYDENHNYLADGIKGYFADPQEVWDDLSDALLLNGKISEADASDKTKLFAAAKDFYRLDAAREKFAKAYYETVLSEAAAKSNNGFKFTDTEISTYYKDNYGGSSTSIFIQFDSETQAKRVMREIGKINTDSIYKDEKGWVNVDYDPTQPESDTNRKLKTVDEVMKSFADMYNYMMINYNNGTAPLTGTEYTLKVSGVTALATAVENLKVATTIETAEFTLPATISTIDKNGQPAGDITVNWKVEKYASSTEDPCVAVEKDEANGIWNATVTRPTTGSKRVKLVADLEYKLGEETFTETKSYTLTIQKTGTEVAISNTAEPVKLQYVIDSVEGLTNYASTNDAIKFNWDYKDIKDYESTISNYVKYDSTKLTLSDDAAKFYKSYTQTPVQGTTYYFLAIKLAEVAPTDLIFENDSDYADKTEAEIAASDALKAEIVKALEKDLVTDNDISRILYENRTKHGLMIYDRYLEAVYEYSYNTFFNTTLSTSNYLPFNKTDKTSKTAVASFVVNGKRVEITADDFFNAMEETYGVLASTSFIDQYVLLSDTTYNEVFNPFTGEVLDKEEYKAALQNEVATIRKNFEYGYFANASLAQYGFIPAFGADYGWKNFKEDYFGAYSDDELLTSSAFGGSIYTNAITEFTEALYASVDAVMAEIQKSYDEYYSVNVMNLVISLDKDFDGNPDNNVVASGTGFEDETPWTAAEEALAKELADLILTLAPQTNKATLTDQMTEIVKIYNDATLTEETNAAGAYDTVYTYNYFAKFKQAGLKLKWESSATYTNTSSIVDEFHDKMKEIYDKIDEQGLVGEAITVPYFSEEAFETSYGLHMVAVIGTTAPVEIPANAKDIIAKHLYISLTEDEQGEDHDALAKLTAEEQEFITTWYTPATQVLGGDNPVSAKLIEVRTAIKDQITYANKDNLAKYDIITKILKQNYEESDK